MRYRQADMRFDHTGNDTPVSGGQIIRQNLASGLEIKMGGEFRADQPVVRGGLTAVEGLSGIQLQCCRHAQVQTCEVQTVLPPGLVLVYLLCGLVKFSLNSKQFQLRATYDSPVALAFNLTEPTEFKRQLLAGSYQEKIVVTLTPACARKTAVRDEFRPLRTSVLEQHFFHCRWRPGEDQIRDCRQILAESNHIGMPLTQEAAVLLLVQSSLMTLLSEQLCYSATSTQAIHPAVRVRHYINEVLARHGPTTPVSLSGIAAQLNMSTSKLQRMFKLHHNTTVMNYIRTQRLIAAREAICQRGATIGEAAFMAGYRHSSNFCLAFKKAFGKNPGEIHRGDKFCDDESSGNVNRE